MLISRLAASAAALSLAGVVFAAPPGGAGALDGIETIPIPGAEVNSGTSGKNLVEVATEAKTFKTLLEAAKEAGLVDTLSDKEKTFTIFAPTDGAFKKLPEGALEAVLKDKEKLKAILLYHVVEGKVSAEDVMKKDGEKVKTLSDGKEIAISVKGKSVRLNGGVRVTKTDIAASNGVIHVINGVLMPPMDLKK